MGQLSLPDSAIVYLEQPQNARCDSCRDCTQYRLHPIFDQRYWFTDGVRVISSGVEGCVECVAVRCYADTARVALRSA
jgi:hypothetical protein